MKKALILAATLIAATPALAHEAGSFIVRAGAAHVAPNDSSSRISTSATGSLAGTKATVNSDTQLGLTFTYKLTDHIGIELLAATPFSHQVNVQGVGAGIDGKLADVKHLPPTVTLQYYPMTKESRWQPYVGAGINYTTFFDEKLSRAQKANGFSSLSLSDSWGLAAQAGMDYMINDHLMFNTAVWYIDIDTQATLRHNTLGKTKVDVDIDPWVFMVGLGYTF
ncbi:MAG TPA: OmpW family outer membrane protein [Azoarcus sp.]|nr:OmpW family outer membrane protein [Azoarcus sp.]